MSASLYLHRHYNWSSRPTNFINGLLHKPVVVCCPYIVRHCQSALAERKTERIGPKIGWSGAERGAGVAENDGAGVERGAGGRGAGTKRRAA